MTLAWTAPDGARALSACARCPVDFVAVVAAGELATERARAALPAQVAHADAVHTAARAALLVAALEQGAHGRCSPTRSTTACTSPTGRRWCRCWPPSASRLGGLPAFGATLSGAGPSVLVWCERGAGAAGRAALDGLGARALPLAVAERGVTVD